MWSPNGQITAQVDTFTISAVSTGQTITATINTKSVTYTAVAADTTTTAATNFLAAINAAKPNIPEFGELTFANPSAGVVTATAGTPGTPFTMTSSGTMTFAQVHTTANSSNSDVNNVNNWLRSGAASLPQNGDDVVISNTNVSLLWNLSSLSAVQFNTLTIWQDFTGTIGLPENNVNNYVEYRPTYFQFTGPPAGTLKILIGEGNIGSGPGRVRLNVGGQQSILTVLTSGAAIDNFAVRFLGTNANNTVSLLNTSLAVAQLPGETSTLASAQVDQNGTLACGSGCTFSGALTLTTGSAILNCAPGTLDLRAASQALIQSTGLTYATVKAAGGSRITMLADGTITTLTLTQASTLDKSGDYRALTITNSNMDGDCQILDPFSSITFTNATSVTGVPVTNGLITMAAGRTVKVT